MQNVNADVFGHIVQYLNLRGFWILSLCSKRLDLMLNKFKDQKRPFFILLKWRPWNETFRKFCSGDIFGFSNLEDLKQFNLKHGFKIWKNQKLIMYLLQCKIPLPKHIYIRAVPYTRRHCCAVMVNISVHDIYINDLNNEIEFKNLYLSQLLI